MVLIHQLEKLDGSNVDYFVIGLTNLTWVYSGDSQTRDMNCDLWSSRSLGPLNYFGRNANVTVQFYFSKPTVNFQNFISPLSQIPIRLDVTGTFINNNHQFTHSYNFYNLIVGTPNQDLFVDCDDFLSSSPSMTYTKSQLAGGMIGTLFLGLVIGLVIMRCYLIRCNNDFKKFDDTRRGSTSQQQAPQLEMR